MAITGNSFDATDRPATEATDKPALEKPSLDKPSGVLVGVSPVNVPAAPKDAAEHFGLLHVLVVLLKTPATLQPPEQPAMLG